MELERFSSRADLERAFEVMKELRTHLSLQEYLELLQAMMDEGYQLWGAVEDGDIKALAGIAFRTNFYYGRYAYVFDLITKSEDRSRGYGAALLEHVERLARDGGCDVVALSSGLERIDAHRFYENKMGYERPSYVFRKTLR